MLCNSVRAVFVGALFTHPEAVKDEKQVMVALMHWEEKWKNMMTDGARGRREDSIFYLRRVENVGVATIVFF